MNSQTTAIITQIEDLVQDVPGWTPIDQLYSLFNLVYLTSDLEGDILEIGSWCGRSSAVLGLAARLCGRTNLICIDLFPEKKDWKQNQDGSYSLSVTIDEKTYGGYEDQTVWKEPFEKDIAPIYERCNSVYDIFTKTIATNNLIDLVKAYRGDSTIIRNLARHKFKLAFIDGDHSYDAVCKDIKNVERYLVEGGWICFDDAFSHYQGVNQAITDLVIKNPDYELCQQMTRKFFIARKTQNVSPYTPSDGNN